MLLLRIIFSSDEKRKKVKLGRVNEYHFWDSTSDARHKHILQLAEDHMARWIIQSYNPYSSTDLIRPARISSSYFFQLEWFSVRF